MDGNSVRVQGNRFVDKLGRHVLLHGVNMVCKDKSVHYVGDWGEKDFYNLKKWGMNVIRFGVIWDGIEPEAGAYNDLYIEELRRLIQLANKFGLFVFLDMHQDLFSADFGDGAPVWATITDGEEYEPGETWSDAYLFNGAVQKSFDHFWNNTPGPDGVGIQDHFIQAWAYLVEKLHMEPNIIGYDLFNEPFIGSPVQQVNEQIFTAFAECYQRKYGEIDLNQLYSAFSDPKEKQTYFSLLDDPETYKEVVDAPSTVLQSFEKKILSEFYRKAAYAIRSIDAERILFLETNYFSNLGTSSMIQPVLDNNGNKDPQQAYSPHSYDVVVDSDLAHTANDRRLEFIFERHEETRQRLDMPMLIGEWGAFYNSHKTGHVALHIKRLMERLLCSDTYWSYTDDMDQSSSFLGIQRAYPIAVAGTLLQYRHEDAIGTYQMKWEETSVIGAPTLIYLPDIRNFKEKDISLSPEGSSYVLRKMDDSDGGYLEIPPITDSIRSLVIVGR
ncbi:cellulase family glycosylhydrolase [Bacillus niameyensis]|uniref:cellulase family glycosylhydrolase n=1 Tax=Bacillus niameyensis TaxID=1522308 RepID=UPI0007850DAD|nr:cellulase family glycosylhydrolase [Bacillus niameyensis]